MIQNYDKASIVFIWKWAKQDGIDHAEDCRVGADAERERNYRNHRESQALLHLPDRETNILKQFVHLKSLVPQRHHGIYLRRAPRGNVRCYQCHNCEDRHSHCQLRWIVCMHAVKQTLDNAARCKGNS